MISEPVRYYADLLRESQMGDGLSWTVIDALARPA
ncbi:hypothetical protein HNR21_001122 [Actinomadura cellulosilytica]|uniref:Uncharacterized protein n=1 Tax=Thermomonospora cellulosilytica TaxID=1411118 RepID=A0A7W3MUP5_9ACTN|nr:hypothetical protein [Thermomonospora cellulosilytica]